MSNTNGEYEDYNLRNNDWSQLPTELWMKIIYQLPRRSLLRLSCTCRRIHKFCHDPKLWKNEAIDWEIIKRKTQRGSLLGPGFIKRRCFD